MGSACCPHYSLWGSCCLRRLWLPWRQMKHMLPITVGTLPMPFCVGQALRPTCRLSAVAAGAHTIRIWHALCGSSLPESHCPLCQCAGVNGRPSESIQFMQQCIESRVGRSPSSNKLQGGRLQAPASPTG